MSGRVRDLTGSLSPTGESMGRFLVRVVNVDRERTRIKDVAMGETSNAHHEARAGFNRGGDKFAVLIPRERRFFLTGCIAKGFETAMRFFVGDVEISGVSQHCM